MCQNERKGSCSKYKKIRNSNIFDGKFTNFRQNGNREICHNIYASLNGKEGTDVIECVLCDANVAILSFLLFSLSCCFDRINVLFSLLLMLLLLLLLVFFGAQSNI